MKHLIIPVVFCFSLIATSCFVNFAQASEEEARKDIEEKIVEQLGDNFRLDHWEVAKVEKIPKGKADVKQYTLKITAVVKEALYQPAGRNENGQSTVNISKAAGDRVELQGIAMAISIPNMPALSQTRVNILTGYEYGQPLSQFPKNIVIAQKSEEPEESLLAKKNNEKTPQSQGSTDSESELYKLLNVYNRTGEVWGTEASRENTGSPVLLRDLELKGNILTGKIHHPYQGLVNDFSLTKENGLMLLRIERATPPDQGVRKATVSCKAEGDELVATPGPRIALTPVKSQDIKKSLAINLEPWKFSGDISDYFSIQNKLYRIDTLKELSSSWIRANSAFRVNNIPSRFISTDLLYHLTSAPYGAYDSRYVKTAEPGDRQPIQPIPESVTGTWVSYDMSEYITLKDGDLWHGEIDWQANAVKQEKKITNIRILNNLEPISWYEDDFYFYRPRATEKPILRVNVRTGTIDELDETNALQRHSYGSPDGRYIFFSDGNVKYLPTGNECLFHIYDCRTHETFTMDSTIDERNYAGSMKHEPRPLKIVPRLWISNSIFITEAGWFDLEKRKKNIFIEAQGVIRDLPEQLYKAVTYHLLPVPDFADVTVESYIKKEKRIYRRYRVNMVTNKALELPMEFEKHFNNNRNITWIDENRYVFSKPTGSLNEVGTWLYDLRTKKHSKLTSFHKNGNLGAENYRTPSDEKKFWENPVSIGGHYLVIPEKNRIIFITKKGNSSVLLSVPLDGGNTVEVPFKDIYGAMRRVLPFSIELPLNIKDISGINARNKINYQSIADPDKTVTSVSAVKTDQGKTTMLDVDDNILKDATEEQIKEAESVYEMCIGNIRYARSVDCKCLAAKFLDLRMKRPDSQKDILITHITQRGCYNIEATIRMEYAHCIESTSFDYNGIPPEDYCQCYSREWGRLLSEYEGKLDEYKKSNLRLKARAICSKPAAYKDK